jgi:hypothetical protein
MTRKTTITAVVAFFAVYPLAPADIVSQLILGSMAALVCAATLLILARFAFVKSASRPMQTLTCVLVCLIGLLSLTCYVLNARMTHQAGLLREQSVTSSSPTGGSMSAYSSEAQVTLAGNATPRE